MRKSLFFFLASFLSLVCQANSLRIIAEDDWYPYSAEKKGKAMGLSVDLVKAAYQAVNIQTDIQTMPYSRCMRLLEAGKEIGCFNTSKDSATLPKYLFSEMPLFTANIAIYAQSTRLGPTDVGLSDLIGRKVGLTNGYTYGDAVEQSTAMFKDYSNSDLQSLKKLAIGRLDYVLAYEEVSNYLLRVNADSLQGKIRKVGVALEVPIYVTFSTSHPQGRKSQALFDKGFERIRQNGTYERILGKWQFATPIRP